MTKKKQPEKEEELSEEELDNAKFIASSEMDKCSEEIWDILMEYRLSPVMIYGVLDSIKLYIANDVYSSVPDEPHICNDCKGELEKHVKESPKKTKEVMQTLYG